MEWMDNAVNYTHPENCKECKGVLMEMVSQPERDGFTLGFRICPNLKAESGTPVPATTDGTCGKRYQLAGMDNKVLAAGGALCELPFGHKHDCQITIEQETQNVVMAVPEDREKKPRVINTIPKPYVRKE
jgi:hypothetical protein